MVDIFCIKSTCFYEQKDLLCRQEERNQKYSTEYGVTFDSLLVHLVSHKKLEYLCNFNGACTNTRTTIPRMTNPRRTIPRIVDPITNQSKNDQS
jgi:hypothetical protein